MRIPLTAKEMASPGVHKLMVHQIDRLSHELDEAKIFRDRYYEVDRKRAVLGRQLQVSYAADVAFGVCLAIGPALIGVAPALWERKPYSILLVFFGFALIAGGIGFRMKQYAHH